MHVFRAHCILQSYTEWSTLTSNTEVLQTVKGMHINIVSSLPNKKSFQYSLNEVETEFVRQARSTKSARKKSQCSHKVWACGTYITHLCQAQKRWWMRLILNMKSLNRFVRYKEFKMDTVSSILHLVRPKIFLVKLDIKDAYYSIPIKESHQKLLKFKFEGKLYKFLALMVILEAQGNSQSYWNLHWKHWEFNVNLW